MGTGQVGAGSRRLRVRSVPAAHPYVRRIHLDGEGLTRLLADPTIPWWPPEPLERGWMARHRGEADVVHVHFGFEQRSPDELRAWCDELAEIQLPLVVTVHDLVCPHDPDHRAHRRRLEVLVHRACTVITLTAGAATEIARRFGRRAEVVQHPNLVPLDDPVVATVPGRVLVDLSWGRANMMDPDEVVPPVARAAAACGGRVTVRLRSSHPFHRRRGLGLTSGHHVDVVVDDRLDDRRFHDSMASAHVVVLPYRFGTHSGRLEVCRDVGTRVVTPSHGYYREQWSEAITFDPGTDRADEATSLEGAVRRALAQPAPAPADRRWRSEQARRVHAAHQEIYTAAIAAAS